MQTNHEHMHHAVNTRQYTLANFMPLIIIAVCIVIITCLKQSMEGWSVHGAMADFMGAFFIIFGGFKLISLHGFAQAYATYDIIAQRSRWYAYLYPFIELLLGIAYLTRSHLTVANWITLALMVIGSIGVARELANNRTIACACLGVVFKIPMTYVTLAEDLLMGLMAVLMLLLER